MKLVGPKGRDFVRLRRGAQYFWAEVLNEDADGKMKVRCDTHTSDPYAPKYGEEFEIPSNETLYDRVKLPR